MKFLRALARIVFGLSFIFSGFMKLADPVGTSLLIKEYLGILHLGLFSSMALVGGIGISALEMTLGVAILAGFRMKVSSWVALISMGFFTLLTLYLALFNPISDCGCFGEAVHFTNWQSFFKNIILLSCSAVIFVQRDKFVPIAADWAEWTYIGAFACLGLCIALDAFVGGAKIDYSPLRPGTDLSEDSRSEYTTTFLYSKGGKNREFSLDNLPDSTWTYVDSRTSRISAVGSDGTGGFSLYDTAGNDVTSDVLTGRQLLVTYYDYAPRKRKMEREIRSFSAVSDSLGTPLNVIVSVATGGLPISSGNVRYYSADRRMLMTLNRSNGGVTYLSGGKVIEKWSATSAPVIGKRSGKIFETSPEELETRVEIMHNLYVEISLFLIVLAAVLIRIISVSHNGRRQRSSSPS
ncbi:MAG: DoxX family protein [Bacteroidales bacterium]|jgi:uncharacterized membrane protein YphA (DoxX/SURF4 family)|nr:DoxX family protein [Bacteroidales bacterium]MCI2121358.1 DoxX family protein [Bacteroidales bacterium]MCI2145241.1 DoxX family protein [Bacteroidales bacterium]